MGEIDEKILARINQLQRQILVHSYIYYKKDSNIWDDYIYDEHCRELGKLLMEYPSEARLTQWARSFENYDPSTGFSLPLDNPWVVNKGEYIYSLRFGEKITPRASNEEDEGSSTLFNITNQEEKKKPLQTVKIQRKLF